MIYSDIAYVPKDDKTVLDELQNNRLPCELKEILQLVDSYPPFIEKKINSVLKRILERNQLHDVPMPRICISANNEINASIIVQNTTPTLILNRGLLKAVQYEDELAGVLAHELTHFLIDRKQPKADQKNKTAETIADNFGVNLLYKAGYDPNGLISFTKKYTYSSGLVTIEQIKNAPSLEDKANLIKNLIDPHP